MKNFIKKCWKKFVDGCKWIVKQIKDVAEWCLENQEVVYVIGAVFSIISWSVKKFHKSSAQRELDYQRTHIYDYSIGHHWTLRRELTSNEMWELTQRKSNGEQLGEILQSMKVLA